jgi:hypothetical protein
MLGDNPIMVSMLNFKLRRDSLCRYLNSANEKERDVMKRYKISASSERSVVRSQLLHLRRSPFDGRKQAINR